MTLFVAFLVGLAAMNVYKDREAWSEFMNGLDYKQHVRLAECAGYVGVLAVVLLLLVWTS
jgi:hypothetical protein